MKTCLYSQCLPHLSLAYRANNKETNDFKGVLHFYIHSSSIVNTPSSRERESVFRCSVSVWESSNNQIHADGKTDRQKKERIKEMSSREPTVVS